MKKPCEGVMGRTLRREQLGSRARSSLHTSGLDPAQSKPSSAAVTLAASHQCFIEIDSLVQAMLHCLLLARKPVSEIDPFKKHFQFVLRGLRQKSTDARPKPVVAASTAM